MADGGRMKGRRGLSQAEREAMEWREFDHRQKLRAATERLGDAELVRLSDGPPPPDPNAGRTIRVTVPGRERVTRHRVDMVGVGEDGRAVYQAAELDVPVTRERMVWHPDTEGRRVQLHDDHRLVMQLPRQWQAEDVLGWLQYARMVQAASTRGDGAPIATLSGLALMMARHAEPQASLVNSRWVPTAGEVTLADWIAFTWMPWIRHAVERTAVAMRIRGESLRKIGQACGFAAADTNHTKSVIRKGLFRVACKLDAMGPQGWPRLAEITFRVDADH